MAKQELLLRKVGWLLHQVLLVSLQGDLCHFRNQPADGKAIRANRQVPVRQDIFQLQSVYNRERPLEQWHRNLEANKAVVLIGSVPIFCNLQCVKPELGLQVRGRILCGTNGLSLLGT